MKRILVTCPPMLKQQQQFLPIADSLGFVCTCPEVVQTLSEDELVELVPQFDGWIIGDDPATQKVFEAGRKGSLRCVVKWGVGIDNVDREACLALGLPFDHTPAMFGGEVADVAICYTIMLARHLAEIDRGVWQGGWPKPSGISLEGKTVGLLGYGDIGSNVASRLQAMKMNVYVYDPFNKVAVSDNIRNVDWPDAVDQCDFVILTCALNESTYHILGDDFFANCRSGVRIVNVSRGPLVDQVALVKALRQGKVSSVALDVFEYEPLPLADDLRTFSNCVFGTHNASNTVDAVARTNADALNKLRKQFDNLKDLA